jgi:hypothetical protein
MTLDQLRRVAYRRPVQKVYQKKADLIAELRVLDRRVADGEPEDHAEHRAWRLRRSIEEHRAESLQEGLEEARHRIEPLLDRPGYSPSFQAGVRAAIAMVQGKDGPSEGDWDSYLNRVEQLLSPLSWAGWEIPESFGTDFDFEHGTILYGSLTRTGMEINFEYEVDADLLTLAPSEPDRSDMLSLLNEEIRINLEPGDRGEAEVAAVAGAHGLLDPT